MNREILRYILGFALVVTVIVLSVLKNNDGPDGYGIPDTPMPVVFQTPDISKLNVMSSFSSPNEQLEEEYLKTLNFVEKLYYRTLGSSERQTRLAKFSIDNPQLLGNILDKFNNQ